jgi:hypothetical protein
MRDRARLPLVAPNGVVAQILACAGLRRPADPAGEGHEVARLRR